VALELKAGRGRVSPAQHAWLAEAERRGWLVKVCWGMDDVLEALQWVQPRNGRRLGVHGGGR